VFREIRRVQAGEAVLVGLNGTIASARATFEVQLHNGTPDEFAEELRAALRRAVARSMGSARRVAVLVSGGLDSSSVLVHALAAARGATRREVDAINWSFGGPGDDRPYYSSCHAG
jgi:asparagine synthetase B (glutamine-hydrolysing)